MAEYKNGLQQLAELAPALIRSTSRLEAYNDKLAQRHNTLLPPPPDPGSSWGQSVTHLTPPTRRDPDPK